jgi:hypothetical protein
LQTFGAEGEDGSRTPRVGCAPIKRREAVARDALEAQSGQGGVVDRFDAEGAARAVALARSEGAPGHVSASDV